MIKINYINCFNKLNNIINCINASIFFKFLIALKLKNIDALIFFNFKKLSFNAVLNMFLSFNCSS